MTASKTIAEVVAQVLSWWEARYRLRKNFLFITDNESHFSNRLMEELSRKIDFRHQYSLACIPWAHGSCEVTDCRNLDLLKILTSEYGLHRKEWVALIPQIRNYINTRGNRRREGLNPKDLFLLSTNWGTTCWAITCLQLDQKGESLRSIAVAR